MMLKFEDLKIGCFIKRLTSYTFDSITKDTIYEVIYIAKDASNFAIIDNKGRRSDFVLYQERWELAAPAELILDIKGI